MMLPITAVRLLLVEDNPGDADLTRERLADIRDAAVELEHAPTLRDAVRILRGPLPDAIILDLNLPDSEGLDTFRRIRELAPDVPTIVLSGAMPAVLRDQAQAEGVAGCLDKSEAGIDHLASSLRFSVALRTAEGRQRQMERLVNSSPDAVVVTDAAGQVRYVNDAALALFGKQREHFVGEHLTFAAPQDRTVEIEVLRGSERRLAEMRSVAVQWEGHSAVMVTLRDNTDARRLSEQLLQAQKMEAVGHLAGGVAHDFNNLITVILAYGSAIKETLQDGDPRREDLAQIMAAADRAKSLTRQLLAFARRQPMVVSPVHLGTLAEGIRQLLGRTLPENVSLTVTVAPDTWPVLADSGQMEQVLINLAVNASDAMPRGGSISLVVDNASSSAPRGDWAGGPAVRLRMSDTGEGIPTENLRRIFDPFFTTKEPGKGSGLGLATCYGIIRQAGGDIEVESTVGQGTTFTILFPRAEGKHHVPGNRLRLIPERLEGHETLLVVEDDDGLRRSIVRVLRRYGYSVLAATNGEEGQRTIEGQDTPIDLIITDLIMPRMGGGELVDYLRRTRPDTRVLCMTGYAVRPGDPSSGLREGVQVIYKPFEPIELVQRIREMLTPAID